jgi:hypothetical protein
MASTTVTDLTDGDTKTEGPGGPVTGAAVVTQNTVPDPPMGTSTTTYVVIFIVVVVILLVIAFIIYYYFFNPQPPAPPTPLPLVPIPAGTTIVTSGEPFYMTIPDLSGDKKYIKVQVQGGTDQEIFVSDLLSASVFSFANLANISDGTQIKYGTEYVLRIGDTVLTSDLDSNLNPFFYRSKFIGGITQAFKVARKKGPSKTFVNNGDHFNIISQAGGVGTINRDNIRDAPKSYTDGHGDEAVIFKLILLPTPTTTFL